MPVCSLFGSGISSEWKVGTVMEPVLIILFSFTVTICMPTHWFGQHSLLQGEPTVQGSVTRLSLPGHCPWAHRGAASSCLLPTHASGQEGLCRMGRYQCTDLMCFNSAHSSCGTVTASPSPTPEQLSQHHAMPS